MQAKFLRKYFCPLIQFVIRRSALFLIIFLSLINKTEPAKAKNTTKHFVIGSLFRLAFINKSKKKLVRGKNVFFERQSALFDNQYYRKELL
jgi:hypothetical protein